MNLRVWEDDGSHAVALRALADAAFEFRCSDDDWANASGGWRVALFDDDDVPLAQAAIVARRLWIGDDEYDTGYVEAVSVAPPLQRGGLGSAVIEEINRLLREQFQLGFLSTGSPSFYERLGWERWQGESYVTDGVNVVRTADEDPGLMALRFGPSAAADLTAPVMCESRPGDDW